MFLFRDFKIPLKREIRCSLKSIWSVGWKKSLFISSKIGFPYPYFINNLNFYYYAIIFYFLDNFTLTSVRIKRTITDNINLLKVINTWRGSRHSHFLPVHGQRTRTNAGTMKSWRQRGSLWE